MTTHFAFLSTLTLQLLLYPKLSIEFLPDVQLNFKFGSIQVTLLDREPYLLWLCIFNEVVLDREVLLLL